MALTPAGRLPVAVEPPSPPPTCEARMRDSQSSRLSNAAIALSSVVIAEADQSV
ncbi:hypothetical protein ACFQ0M_17240 [Kitasatospora aburaviensis]